MSGHREKGLPLARMLVLAPIAAVAVVLAHYAVNIPCLDDYNATLQFVLQQRPLGAGARLLQIVAFQHGEYKLIFEHGLLAAWYAVTGGLSLPVFLAFGNLLLLPVGWVLWRDFVPGEARLRTRLLLFAPISLLFFQLSYAELLDWVMTSLNGIAVVTFALLSLHWMGRPRRMAFAGACVTAALACSASGNGFMLAPVGLLVLAPGRRVRRMLAWVVPFATMLPLYLYRYVPAVHVSPPHPVATRLLFFVSFLGGAVENISGNPVRYAAYPLGAAIALVFAHSAGTRFWRRAPVPFAVALWVLLTAAVVASIRSSLGVQQSLASRYKIYSALLLIYSYVYLQDRLRLDERLRARWWAHRRTMLGGAVAAALLFSVSADVVGARFLARRRDHLIEGMRRYRADPEHTSPLYVPEDPQDFAASEGELERVTLRDAIAAGLYSPPESTRPDAASQGGARSPTEDGDAAGRR